MSSGVPAVIVAEKNGTVISQNAPARRLLGQGRGKSCWDLVGKLEGAEGLPCRRNCVGELVDAGSERTQHTRLKVAGQRHFLTCVPVDGVVVCVLSRGACEAAGSRKSLTLREQEVLRLLSDGETSPTAAARLGVSESTLRTHVEKMRDKFAVNTRAALVALGFRLGYLE